MIRTIATTIKLSYNNASYFLFTVIVGSHNMVEASESDVVICRPACNEGCSARRDARRPGERRRGRWAAPGGDVSQGGGSEPTDWRNCARCYRIWDRCSIDKTAARGRAAPVPFAQAAREAVFTLALFVIPLGPWAEEQVVPDGMGTDAELPSGPHLLSLADISALGFDCSLKPVAVPASGNIPADLNTPVTTSDLPAFFPNLLEPPPISGGFRPPPAL